MRKILLALAVAAIVVLPVASVTAQSAGEPEPGEPSATAAPEPGEPRAEGQSPNITVKEDRLVCRRRARTGTRMGTSRVCRTQAEWQEAERDLESNAEITGETLDVLGADDASTGDQGGLTSGHETPLGPR